MSDIVQNPNEAWRNFTKQASISACKLRRDDLKRIYRLINEKQTEVGNNIVSKFFQTTEETPEQFQVRCTNVKNAFITTVSITGENGNVVTGHGDSFFDSPLLPERISSILYDTSFSPNAQLKFTPNDRASILLDFSRPPLLNLGTLPSAPTPNNSNWFISAENESWCTSLSARLDEFFTQRLTRLNWLHQSAVYDALLFVMGFPLSLWGSYRLSKIIDWSGLPSALSTAIYVYAFLLLLNVFRVLFSYTRWVFPKVELESEQSPVMLHRTIWSAIMFSVFGSAVWDGIKALL
jgi:hypothetical protein